MTSSPEKLSFSCTPLEARLRADLETALPQPEAPTDPSAKMTTFQLGDHASVLSGTDDVLIILSTHSRGKLVAKTNGYQTEAMVRPGLLTFVPAGLDQTYDFSGLTTNLVMHLSPAVFNHVTALENGLPSTGVLEPNMAFFNPAIQRLVEDYARVCCEAKLGWRVEREALSNRIAVELLSFFGGRREGCRTTPLDQHEVARLADFIEAHMDSELDLALMASLLGREPFGFARAFKAATGESPHQFVIHRRLARVRAMLEAGGESLAEIAYATGFSSQSHMTATFTRHIGMPPGRYRQEVRT